MSTFQRQVNSLRCVFIRLFIYPKADYYWSYFVFRQCRLSYSFHLVTIRIWWNNIKQKLFLAVLCDICVTEIDIPLYQHAIFSLSLPMTAYGPADKYTTLVTKRLPFHHKAGLRVNRVFFRLRFFVFPACMRLCRRATMITRVCQWAFTLTCTTDICYMHSIRTLCSVHIRTLSLNLAATVHRIENIQCADAIGAKKKNIRRHRTGKS